MRKNLFKFAGALILLFVFSNHLFSQGQSTTQGKDFWLSYGSNYTLPANGNMLQLRIVATKAAKVTLTFTQDGTTETLDVAAGQVVTRTFNAAEAAKVYSNVTGASNKSLHVVSNELITLFAININKATTDATNVLPVTNYGQSYRHISYKSIDGIGDGYTVIAVENDTKVSENGAEVTTLQKGQVYSKYVSGGDMTGTLITSDKPIAYFTTNTCVQVPNGTTACDCLFQQQAPVHSWGNKFLIPVTKRGIERVRVVASQDGTTITQTGGTVISGVGVGSLSLNAGQFVELQVSLNGGGCYIESDKPVAVASFLTGLNFSGLTYKNGDPAMAWVPPVEQTVMHVALAPFVATGTSVLAEHYALIVTPTATKEKTTMTIGTGVPQVLSGGTWTDNPASGFSFYSLQLTDLNATYYFENAEGLSVMGYGLGSYESYFYLAASSARQLNPAFYLNDIHFEDANEQTYCAGEFKVRGVAQMQIAPGADALTWYIDGVEQVSARGKLEWTIPSLTLNTPHTITMIVKGIYGEVFTLNTVITVVDPKPLKITGNRYICPPAQSTVLTAESGPTYYQWYKNGAAVLGATQNTYTVSSIDVGDYSVIGHYGTCSSPMSDTVTVIAGCEPTLKIAYDGNSSTGGTPPTDDVIYVKNTEVTVKAKGDLVRTGAVFLGWSFGKTNLITAKADEPADLIKAGEKFNITADTTLYAVWAKDTNGPNGGSDGIPDYEQRFVTYDGNGSTGGTLPTDANAYQNNAEVTVKAKGDLVRTGAVFLGWSFGKTNLITAKAGEPADLIKAGEKFNITADTTLYAVWAKDTNGPNGGSDGKPDYEQRFVTYKGNEHTGGTPPTDANLYDKNAEVTVKDKGDLVRTGATFIGWSFGKTNLITAKADEPADLKKAGNKFNITGDTTLYAVWAKDVKGPNGSGDGIPDYEQRFVTYNGNGSTGGTLPTDANAYQNNDEVTVKDKGDLVRSGAVFLGWNFEQKGLITAKADVPTNLIKAGNKFNITADTTLYAVWAKDVKGPNGGSDGIPDYLQTGVTYNGNDNTGGTPPTDANLYNKNDEVTVKDKGDLVRTGAVFLGWSFGKKNLITAKADEPTDLKKAGEKFNITVDTTLYAVWAKDVKGPNGGSDGIPDYEQRFVTYDGNGHTGGMPPTDANAYDANNKKVTVKDKGNLVRSGAVFLGWSFEQKGLIMNQADEPADLKKAGETFDITADVTLYAVWANDADGNGIPDYMQIHITWHPGAMRGTPQTETMARGNIKFVDRGFTARNYVLIGWHTSRMPVVRNKAMEQIVMKRPTFYAKGSSADIQTDKTFYAVWAIDKDNDGSADYDGLMKPKSNRAGLRTLSEEIRFSISDEAPITDIRVWTYAHMLHIESDRVARADIYTSAGMLVKRIDLAKGLTSEPLNAGMYIIAIEGKRFKVFVK